MGRVYHTCTYYKQTLAISLRKGSLSVNSTIECNKMSDQQ